MWKMNGKNPISKSLRQENFRLEQTLCVLKEDDRARKANEGTPNKNDELKKYHLPEKSLN